MDTPPLDNSVVTAVAVPVERRQGRPITITTRTIWLAVVITLASLGVVFMLTKVLSALVLLFIAIILGEAIRPAVRWLNARAHLPRAVAVLLIYLGTFIIVCILGAILLNPVLAQIGTFSNHLPTYLTQIQRAGTQIQRSLHANADLERIINSLATQLAGALQNIVPALLSVPVTALTSLFSLLISLIVVLTMALFWLTTTDSLKPFVLGLLPEQRQEQAASIVSEMGRSLGGYVRGTLVDMVVIGALTSVGLFVLGVPYALLLGLVAGLTELIPYLGPWISGGIAVLVALAAVDPLKALEVFIFFQVLQQLEGNTIAPLVLSRAVHVNPLLVIVAILFGVELLGLIGAILAVPMAAIIQVLVLRVLAPVARQASKRTQPMPRPIAIPAPADDPA